MNTECTDEQLHFHGLGRRAVVADFQAGHTTSDCGLLLLREVAERTDVLKRFSGCFTDYRRLASVDHQVNELIAQRVFGLCLGLWFASVAYVLMNLLRRLGLQKTQLKRAHAGTIRPRLLKIGALMKVSVRRIYASMSSAFPLKSIFAQALADIARWKPPRR